MYTLKGYYTEENFDLIDFPTWFIAEVSAELYRDCGAYTEVYIFDENQNRVWSWERA